jgi:hypothetical protein
LNARYDNINADDYKWNAEQFNLRGAELKRDGLQLGYHNHSIDLRVFGRRSRCAAKRRRMRCVGRAARARVIATFEKTAHRDCGRPLSF